MPSPEQEAAELARHAEPFAAKQRIAAAERAEAERVAAEAAARAEAERIAAEEAAQAEVERIAAEEAEAERIAAEAARAEAERVAAEQRAAAEAAKPAPQVEEIAATARFAITDLNVRSGPGTEHPRIGHLAYGQEIQVSGKAGAWYRTTDGGWCHGGYLADAPPAPKPERPKAPARSDSSAPQPQQQGATFNGEPIAWSTWVSNRGGQAAVDQKLGGLTHWSPDWRVPYYPIHRGAGGAPILSLHEGDVVEIRGVGFFRVGRSVDIPKVANQDISWAIDQIHPVDAFVQTCYKTRPEMRLVGLVRIG